MVYCMSSRLIIPGTIEVIIRCKLAADVEGDQAKEQGNQGRRCGDIESSTLSRGRLRRSGGDARTCSR